MNQFNRSDFEHAFGPEKEHKTPLETTKVKSEQQLKDFLIENSGRPEIVQKEAVAKNLQDLFDAAEQTKNELHLIETEAGYMAIIAKDSQKIESDRKAVEDFIDVSNRIDQNGIINACHDISNYCVAHGIATHSLEDSGSRVKGDGIYTMGGISGHEIPSMEVKKGILEKNHEVTLDLIPRIASFAERDKVTGEYNSVLAGIITISEKGDYTVNQLIYDAKNRLTRNNRPMERRLHGAKNMDGKIRPLN